MLLDLLMNEEVVNDFRTTLETRLQRPVSAHGLRCDISQADDCEQAVRQVQAAYQIGAEKAAAAPMIHRTIRPA